MNFAKTVLTSVITSALCFGVLCMVYHPTLRAEKSGTVVKSAPKETAYDRVMRTKTLRCGYALWPALIEKDPNGGRLSGIFVDYLEELGHSTGLKIEWTAELGFGDFVEALRVGRIDAMCSGTWTNAQRGMVVDFVTPISYQGVTAFVRADDTRFDHNLQAINSPEVTISTVEGASSQEIAETFFSKAKLMSLPQLSESSQQLLNVVSGKADVTFTDRYTVGQFLANNPGQLREVPADYPVNLFGNPIAVAKGEYALKQSLDNATQQLINVGIINQIIKKHETYPNTIYRPAVPYINQ